MFVPKMESFLWLGVLLVALISLTCAGKVVVRPPYLPTCKQSDPEINKCILAATEDIREHLVSGMPELQLQSIEPFKIPKIDIEQGTRSLNIKATATNVLLHGLSHYKFKRFDLDVSKWKFYFQADVPDVVIEGDYIMDGNLFVAPLKGKGKFKIILAAGYGNMTTQCHIIEKKGMKYLSAKDSIKIELGLRSPKAHFDGLFGENKDVGELTNKVINDNINEMFEDLKAIFEDIVAGVVGDIFNKILGGIPVDMLFPPK